MNITEEAFKFAVLAHYGQIRKGDGETPFLLHPIAVGEILRDYGANNEEIAAGYLHDIVEDTNYTLEDIEKKFGKNIANLVNAASEPDHKNLSWEERKTHTISSIRDKSLSEKIIVASDKINNIESLIKLFNKIGKEDFSNFNKGKDYQEWYYRNIYKSLINNEDENNPLFVRLAEGINKVFGRTMEEYFLNNNENIKI